VLFFLAHAGVQQPDVWERWMAECAAAGCAVVARVYSTEEHWDDAFIKTAHRNLAVRYTTRWGDPSLVKVQQVGYAQILAEFDARNDVHLDMIFLVSGFDVPVIPPAEFGALKSASYIPRVSNLERLAPVAFRKLALAALCKTQPTLFSVQWIHLLPQHARVIAEAELDPFVEWLDALNATHAQTYVYDEVIPTAMLHARHITLSSADIVDDALTGMHRASIDAPSPIVFTDLHALVDVCCPPPDKNEDDGDGDGDTDGDTNTDENEWIVQPMSLAAALKEHRAVSSLPFCFFRKVGATVVFSDGMLPWTF
jgi:hypothetical protein